MSLRGDRLRRTRDGHRCAHGPRGTEPQPVSAIIVVVASEHLADEPWRPGAPVWPGAAWDRLAAQAYVGARDGRLSRDAAFDLACFLLEWAAPNRLFTDLAEASLETDDLDRLADLAHQALDAVAYVPDFATEPRRLASLEQVLAKVVPDLRTAGVDGTARLVVLEGNEPPRAYVRYRGRRAGHSSGLTPSDAVGTLSSPDTLVLVADELQEAVMDSLGAVWPVCSDHQFGPHPRAIENQAVWWCAGGAGHAIAAIGNLK